MKILMVLDHEFPPDIRVENEIEALTSSGNEVHLACYTFTDKPSIEKNDQVTIHRKRISKFIYKTSVGALKFPFYFNFWKKFLQKITEETGFDAIHIHDLPLAKVGYNLTQKKKMRFTLDLHENWPALLEISEHTNSLLGKFLSSNSQWKNYEMKYCQLADDVIVVVEEAKSRLVNSGVDQNKISVVSNTLNKSHFTLPTSFPDEDYFSLLYAGGINKHRGLQVTIKGLKFIEPIKKIRLWILGSGSYVEELETLVKNENLEEKVIFTGWLSYSDMQELFGKSNACLIPHIKSDHTDSTIPHKLFQYMYAGKPVISSNCAPIERVLNETKSGLVYKYDDPRDFARQVNELMKSQEMYNELSENGKKAIDMKYNWEMDKKILQKIYN